jgi:hypothetical protein
VDPPFYTQHYLAEVVDVEIAENAVGDMVGAVLVLKCSLIPITSYTTAIGIIRDAPAPIDEDEREYYLILIRSRRNGTDGMVIEHCDSQPGYYRRIGFASGRTDDLCDLFDVYSSLEKQNVKLV